MAFCENCIHYEVCETDYNMMSEEVLTFFPHNEDCKLFKPTADVVEVKHGEWIVNPAYKYGGDYMCSICGNDADESTFGSYDILTNYCSKCGAKMDGGVE